RHPGDDRRFRRRVEAPSLDRRAADDRAGGVCRLGDPRQPDAQHHHAHPPVLRDQTVAGRAIEEYHPGMRFRVRVLLNALAIAVDAYFVPGVILTGPGPAIFAGVILGFINAIVRPILLLLTLPFTLLTLGLFIFVVTAICFGLTAALVPGFD